MNTNTATKTATIITVMTPRQEELQREIALANERNRKQLGAEFYNTNEVLVWGVRIGKAHDSKPNRFFAKLSRALLVAPIAAENKGHRMSGAFKAIEFQFDSKTGEVFAMTGETADRKALLAKWAKPLIEKHIDGLRLIANGATKTVKGYNQLRAVKFETFVARYNGTQAGKTFEDTPIAKDAEETVLDD